MVVDPSGVGRASQGGHGERQEHSVGWARQNRRGDGPALRVGASGPTGDGHRDLWRDRAACRAVPTEWFFPVGRTADSVEQTEAAKAVCRFCPVREFCLGFALETNQEVGIWGDATEDERQGLRRAWLEASRHHRSINLHNGPCSGPVPNSSVRLSATGGNIEHSDGARDAALLGN